MPLTTRLAEQGRRLRESSEFVVLLVGGMGLALWFYERPETPLLLGGAATVLLVQAFAASATRASRYARARESGQRVLLAGLFLGVAADIGEQAGMLGLGERALLSFAAIAFILLGSVWERGAPSVLPEAADHHESVLR